MLQVVINPLPYVLQRKICLDYKLTPCCCLLQDFYEISSSGIKKIMFSKAYWKTVFVACLCAVLIKKHSFSFFFFFDRVV